MDFISIIMQAIADAPGIVDAVKSALSKAGYSNAQIDAIFAPVLPPDQLGIDPNHPVAQEGGPGGTEPVPPVNTQTNPPAAISAPPLPAFDQHVSARTPEQAAALAPINPPVQSQADAAIHVSARSPEQAAALDPAPVTSQPDAALHVSARTPEQAAALKNQG